MKQNTWSSIAWKTHLRKDITVCSVWDVKLCSATCLQTSTAWDSDLTSKWRHLATAFSERLDVYQTVHRSQRCSFPNLCDRDIFQFARPDSPKRRSVLADEPPSPAHFHIRHFNWFSITPHFICRYVATHFYKVS